MAAPPINQQPIPAKDTAAARKRRRRAPAGGASDDCFTCTKRNVKCDRRRPYCSQCLEVSNECSGYKTQLTWGVGVASRGKLRGLSLPVAKAPPAYRDPKKPTMSRARSNSTAIPKTGTHGHNHSAGSLQWPDHEDMRSPGTAPPPSRGPIDIPTVSQPPAASAPATPYGMPGYDYLSLSHPDNTPPMPHHSWGSVGYSPNMVHSPDEHARYGKFPLALVTEGLSSSVSSVNSDLDYMSPLSQSYPRDDVPFVNSPGPGLIYDSYSSHQNSPVPQSPPSNIGIDHTRAPPTSCPSLVYPHPDHPSTLPGHHLDVFEVQVGPKMMRDPLNVPDVGPQNTGGTSAAGPSLSLSAPQDQQHQQVPHPHHEEEQLLSPRSEGSIPHWPTDNIQTINITQDIRSRMPFFMDYYSNTICRSMVFIDGPGNPFREHIMQLANSSPSLQHAICALSACNLRMRRKLSLGQDPQELSSKLVVEKQAVNDQELSEENEHRNLAVSLLNQQLNDPAKSTHDSVLATILLLSHYRMVESGIAKFYTQFAGVKKIMSIRRSREISPTEASWMEGVFTHFDAISASINDREAQLSPPPTAGLVGSSDDPLPPGAENLVGCDRGLFKTIAKLGRLNLLSQHRPVQSLSTSTEDQGRSQSPFTGALGHTHKCSTTSSAEGYSTPPGSRFDGNGFGSTLEESDVVASMARSTGMYDVHRSAFWKEWKETRLALQNWQFDSASVTANLPSPASATQVRDLGSVSEAFRYAALLYTERLASPTLPSSHSNFQNLVSQVVYYTTSLEAGSSAEKFLLWPLFVAGSECVNELQQNIVRSKCRDMMARSGYMNNLSALDVLETLWAAELKESEARGAGTRLHIPGRRSPFNWSKCISGSADVEWIMF